MAGSGKTCRSTRAQRATASSHKTPMARRQQSTKLTTFLKRFMNGCSRQDRTLTSRTAAAPSSSRRAILLSAESRSVECFIRPPISIYRHCKSRAGLNHGYDAEGGATDLLLIGIAESAIASGPLVSDDWRWARPLWSCLRNVRQPFAPPAASHLWRQCRG